VTYVVRAPSPAKYPQRMKPGTPLRWQPSFARQRFPVAVDFHG
jgi:hypothetical protein